MSQENVDVVRRSFEAFGRGDFPAVLETMHADVEWTDPETLPWGGTHRGHDGFGRHMLDFMGHFDEVRIDPDQFLDAGDSVVVTGRMVGRAQGQDVNVPTAFIWRLEGGKARQVVTFTDTAAVVRAVAARTAG
jgi:uncharacterized protein